MSFCFDDRLCWAEEPPALLPLAGCVVAVDRAAVAGHAVLMTARSTALISKVVVRRLISLL
ncbi:hypothetical protein ACF06D_29860 [Streptomyces griseoluteus]|uniref:hypothetical protein n=1 Tax=Streptomyces TaxID=1883 RepID=UPI000A37E1DB|nr:hypothetical protein [Streptomyces recifensis]